MNACAAASAWQIEDVAGAIVISCLIFVLLGGPVIAGGIIDGLAAAAARRKAAR